MIDGIASGGSITVSNDVMLFNYGGNYNSVVSYNFYIEQIIIENGLNMVLVFYK